MPGESLADEGFGVFPETDGGVGVPVIDGRKAEIGEKSAGSGQRAVHQGLFAGKGGGVGAPRDFMRPLDHADTDRGRVLPQAVNGFPKGFVAQVRQVIAGFIGRRCRIVKQIIECAKPLFRAQCQVIPLAQIRRGGGAGAGEGVGFVKQFRIRRAEAFLHPHKLRHIRERNLRHPMGGDPVRRAGQAQKRAVVAG